MNNRKIIEWNPFSKDNDIVYNIEALVDDYDGLKIILKGENIDDIEKTIIFEDYYGYRNFDESFRLKTLNSFDVLCKPRVLFKVAHSDFLNWFKEESLSMYESEKLNHFIIATPNDIIDVISKEEPIVKNG